MRFAVFAPAILLLLFCASARGKTSTSDKVNVLYSVTVDQRGRLELSVYNPTDRSACTSMLNWPGDTMLGDELRVLGRDGRRWKYSGPELSVAGKVRDLKIAPGSSVTTHIDVRKYYQPVSSETRLGKVYFGALFRSC